MIAAIVLFTIAAIVAVVLWCYLNIRHVNEINEQFTRHCNSLGGHAIISDRDLCVSPDGRILDHEG